MSATDFAEAHKSSAELRAVIIQSMEGPLDSTRLDKVVGLCLAGSKIDDEECRKQMRSIHAQAADLFSESAHAKWSNGSIDGRNVLRLQILRMLDLYNHRVNKLESMYGAASSDVPDASNPPGA